MTSSSSINSEMPVFEVARAVRFTFKDSLTASRKLADLKQRWLCIWAAILR